MSESQSLASQIGRASAVIMIWATADKFLALGKEVITAHRFGVSAALDAFNLAQAFPGILVLFFSSALVSAFVPLYLEWRNRESFEAADSQAVWLIALTTAFFALLALLCFLASPLIIRLVGYGFEPGETALAIRLERILALLILIDGAGILCRGMLHARKMFFHLQMAPILVNATIILFLYFDADVNIHVLVLGFLAGTLLKTAYMVFALRRSGFSFRAPLPHDRAKTNELLLLAVPFLGSALIANSNIMIDQAMATQLSTGSVSTLRYAFRINDLPIQMVIAAVSHAIFPFLSEEAAAGRRDHLQDIFKYSLIFLGFLTIPITALMILFAEDYVTLLLMRGAFDQEAARQTGQTLVCYSLGLFFYAYAFINGTFFTALKKTKVLFYMGVVSIFLNVLFNFLFMHYLGVRGIALSTSVTMGVISIWYIFLLNDQLGITTLRTTLSCFSRMLVAAAMMMGAALALAKALEMVAVARPHAALAASAGASLVYLAAIWAFRTAELDGCIGILTRQAALWKKRYLG